MIKVIAHRVNSIGALERAISQGAQGIECDVQLTQDGHLVLYHNRMFGGKEIGQMRAEEVLQLHNEDEEGSLAITLDKLIINLKNNNKIESCFDVFIELKGNQSALPEKVLQLLAGDDALCSKVVMLSFNPDFVQRVEAIKQASPDLFAKIRTGLNIGKDSHRHPQGFVNELHVGCLDECSNIIKGIGVEPNVFSLDCNLLQDDGGLEVLKESGAKVICWTVNDASILKKVAQKDVDAVITDEVKTISSAL